MESADSRSLWLRLAKAARPNVLLKTLSGAAIVWAALQDDGSNASAVHLAFVRETWLETGWPGRIGLFLGFAVRLPVIAAASAVLTRRCGPRIRRATGKGLLRQAREQFALARKLAVPPMWYYMFEFYEDERRLRALEYLYRFETKAALYGTLRKSLSDPASTAALSDKAAFATRCERHGLPAVRALAIVRNGSIHRLDDGGDALPRGDLFFKPLRGAGGRGASRWTCRRDGLYHGDKGTVFDEAQLVEFLRGLSRIEDYVVRARASNHSDLADLSCGALSTVRVVTCLDRTGRPEVAYAVLRMPSSPDAVVDNFHAGGVAAAVDLETGVLGRATDMGLRADSRWWDAHPVSGAPITGRVVPMWPQVLDLARRAHGIFADQIAIGWDIAVCDAGPLLVEGNKSPDLDIIQRVRREPLGNSRFGELLLFHIGRAQSVESMRRSTHGRWTRRVHDADTCDKHTGDMQMTDPSRLHAGRPQISPSASGTEVDSAAAKGTAPIFEIAPGADRADPALRELARATLEGGGLVVLPCAGFGLSERERALVADAAVTLPTRKERESRNGRPTVIYDPDRGRIVRSRMPSPGREELEAMMARYSDWSATLIAGLFPDYRGRLVRDRLTYRPCERADAQGMHVDASYGRPTEGRGMLRVFCNINPAGQPRVWRIGETFEPFARRYMPTAKPPRTSRIEALLAKLGITKGRRTAYDRLMADIRGQVKADAEYQRAGPQRTVSFPAGAAWIAITDLVMHGASSGQHSLDQTFFLPAEAMREPGRASLRILERLSGRTLV